MGVEKSKHKFTCDICAVVKEDHGMPTKWRVITLAQQIDPTATNKYGLEHIGSEFLVCSTCSGDHNGWAEHSAARLGLFRKMFAKFKGGIKS